MPFPPFIFNLCLSRDCVDLSPGDEEELADLGRSIFLPSGLLGDDNVGCEEAITSNRGKTGVDQKEKR